MTENERINKRLDDRFDKIDLALELLRLEMKAMYENFDTKLDKLIAMIEAQNEQYKIFFATYKIPYSPPHDHSKKVKRLRVRNWSDKQI